MRSLERVLTIDSILQGIARRSAYKFKDKSVEDISQDLWVKILEKEEKEGRELDLDLIAKICYDEIINMQRYEIRRNHLSLNDIEETSEESEGSNLCWCSRYDTPEAYCEKEILKDLFKIFPRDSREYIFLEYWANATGFLDTGVVGRGTYNEGFTEKDLAKRLGFASSTSGGYTKFRHKFRILIHEYLGDDEK